jgi:NAD(P)-dependent dehydrogenase (short-subunit alcohol dehydrogenase family)
MYKVFAPGREHPTFDDAAAGFSSMHILPVPYVEADDISNAVLFLASDESRMITGLQLTVDAGCLLKEPYHGV